MGVLKLVHLPESDQTLEFGKFFIDRAEILSISLFKYYKEMENEII